MEVIQLLFDVVFNIDTHLPLWAQDLNGWIYLIVFIIIFCETGLVIAPFLPGDSFLFLIGTLCGAQLMNPYYSVATVFCAALLGDSCNYTVGKLMRGQISPQNRLIRQKYLKRTEDFFDKHGGKSLIMARYLPIIRTYAPFVGGLVRMPYSKFISFNIIGALSWPLVFIPLGYFLGRFEFITNNIGKVVIGIILISLIPIAYGILKNNIKKH